MKFLMLVIHSSCMLCKRIDPWSSKFVNWAAAKHCALSIKTIFHSYKTWLFHEISNCLLWWYSCLNIVADADQWSWKQTVNHSNLELITKETIWAITANITISPANIYVNVYLLPKKKNTSCQGPSKAIESCKVHRTKELLTLIVPENCNLILELRPILYSVVIYCSHAKLS